MGYDSTWQYSENKGGDLLLNPTLWSLKFSKLIRYYPKVNFLDVDIGHNLNYIWRSIWSSRVLIKEGLRWSIGDGTQISFWTDHWLHTDGGNLIGTPPHYRLADMKVNDLLVPG